MRKRIYLILLLVVFIGLASFCARKVPEINKDDVKALLENIAQSPMELEIKADISDINIEPGKEQSQYQITLTNPEVIFSTAVYKHLNMEFPELDIPIELGKMVMIYDPLENNIQLESAEKIKSTLMSSEIMSAFKSQQMDEGQEVPELMIHYYLEKIALDGYDISALLDAKEKSFEEVLTDLIASNNKMKVKAEGFKVNITGQEGDVKTIELSMEGMESFFQAEPGLVTAFLQKQDSVDILSELLEKKEPLIDIEIRADGMDLLVDTPKQNIRAGLDKAGLSYSLKQSPEGDYFDFTSGWDLRSLVVEGIPEKALIFTKLNEAVSTFSIENLSPEFINAYFDLAKIGQSAGAAKDAAVQQEIAMKGLILVGKLIESKPIIKISLSPIDHYFGEIQAQGEFQFIRIGPPVGKAEAKIMDMDKMGQNIKQSLPPERAEAVINWLTQMFQADESGQAKMTFEIKENDPSHFYLNGEKHAFKQ
jgi:hypothetical protein